MRRLARTVRVDLWDDDMPPPHPELLAQLRHSTPFLNLSSLLLPPPHRPHSQPLTHPHPPAVRYPPSLAPTTARVAPGPSATAPSSTALAVRPRLGSSSLLPYCVHYTSPRTLLLLLPVSRFAISQHIYCTPCILSSLTARLRLLPMNLSKNRLIGSSGPNVQWSSGGQSIYLPTPSAIGS